MKFPVWVIVLVAVSLAVVFSAGIIAAPPLKVNTAKPLLLDEPKAAPKKQVDGPVADNSACHVCHTNYQEETLAVVHAEADVGCVKCHGASLAHRNDENNTTPPEKMYPVESIEPACIECHETHDAPARKVLTRWKERCPEKTDFAQVLCTDCHGEHRLKLRTVRWDKKTGKVLLASPAPASSGSNSGVQKP
ncbi:MAG: cytochrome c3 family protein [Thermoguttaceae bacterium]|jgi:formate-dependent nitrite reductase cytochrome c552 subunit|nr:cytochrome c3 family protein [Thermoguttaceae bacterium]